MTKWRTNDGEWTAKTKGTDDLPLFAGETGIDTPPANRQSGEAERDRVITAMGDEEKRRDWIDRIHALLVYQITAIGYYDGIVSANDARAVYLTFPDADPSIDFRFLAALWRKKGWVFVDWEGKSEAPGTHARRIARYRYERPAEVK